MECIMTILHMCCRSLTFSSPSSAAAAAAGDDDDDDGGIEANIPPRREKYDVFISFRGEDTRLGITSHLHAALLQKKIETYIDYRLQRGEEIGPALLEAIEKSTISVIIFSQNYSSSTWCLDEIVHILECKERYGQMVIPVFYNINPSDVRNQHGTYADAFAQLEKRFKDNIDKVHKWRDALTTAAKLSGFDYSNNSGTEADLIQKVVDHIWTKLCLESSCDLKGFVGIESRIEQIESLLGIHSPDACITVGIWGMGGIGKTTLAETLFYKLSSKFEASCFLRNVREREQKEGLEHLQNELLSQILKEKGLSIGSTNVRKRLSHTKVIIVLDDVSNSMQMERLAAKHLHYGTGSRIIITSRDKRILRQTVEECKIYKVGGLQWDNAFQLFCSHAFKNNSTPRTDYRELAKKAVSYAGGVPLALILLGSSFLNCKSKEDWEDELDKLKEFPNENIQSVLRLSYDGLGRYEKEIFLDVACFHNGEDVNEVIKLLAIHGRFAAAGIRVLVDMSLISIHHDIFRRKTIQMHDLLQEMGRTIIQEQCIEDPGKRNRLFADEDVYHVLKSNTILVNLEVIDLHYSEYLTEVPNLSGSLKIVHINLGGCKRLVEIPWYFQHLDKLTHLDLTYCNKLKYLAEMPANIKYLNLEGSGIKELPESIWSNENISYLNISRCKDLEKLPSNRCKLKVSDGFHIEGCTSLGEFSELPKNISKLSLVCFKRLVSLPANIWKLKYLNELDLSGCTKLKNFPKILEPMEHLKSLNLSGTAVEELHSSIKFLPHLQIIQLQACRRLSSISNSICRLKYLNKLDLSGCTELENFPEILEPMEHLKSLNLSGTAVEELHLSIEFLPHLQIIQLQVCRRLSSISNSICKLKYLKKLDLSCCFKLEDFPEISEELEHLVSLILQGTGVEMLPSSIENLIKLQTLDLSDCRNLKDVPTSIYNLTNLKSLYFSNCRQLEKLPSSSVGFLSLEVLDLKYSGILEIPGSLVCSTSLRSLSLSGTKITSIPASIKLASRLSKLNIVCCKRLQSLPELPVLCNVEAQGCKSLKTVSNSRTALT
ncbi:disease resistance protein RUN1 isoform X2 [Pyrus x bretschneideri]|uniref:disease resistance protein RUN1 isoform X2 n=1 Tax=Pyrus x bretschneideri TaxID=225117 RepID=UPI0020305D8A|nr:disease resistance protein RUN1 isoform X2 [Pyrus x bretschneideri]